MNCQDFNQLVDSVSPGDLDEVQHGAMHRHLASCSSCSEDWANWREVAELAIPATPVMLRGRIAAALPAGQTQQPRRAFRPFLVGGVLLFGAAAAAILAWRSGGIDGGPAPQSSTALPATASAAPVQPTTEASAAVADATNQGPAPVIPMESSATGDGDLDPLRFIVLFRPEAGADHEAVASTSQCHDALVSRLRAVPQFEIIADGKVVPEVDSNYMLAPDDAKKARAHGAGHVLIVSTEMGCYVTGLSTQTGMLSSGMGRQLLPQGGYAASAAGMVQQISDKLLKNPATLWAEAKAMLLNDRLSDRERAAVLWRIGEYKGTSDGQLGRSAVDDEIVAAAAQLGATSADPDVRGTIWATMRNVDDPQLIPPLLKALASDPEAKVRMQAAFTLRTFLDEPGVRADLLRAAAEDPDSEPAAACCIYTVREAAERAAVPDRDFREWVRARLYDESLPAHSRLRPLEPSTMDNRVLFLRDAEFGAEAARVVFDLGRQAQDPQVRVQAWEILYFAAPDLAFVPGLLSDLAGHPDEYVRANAAMLLYRHEGNPDVRKALDKALEDPSMHVRIAANGTQRPFRE